MNETLHVVCPACQAVNRIPHARLADGPVCGKCRQSLFRGAPVDLDTTKFRKQLERGDLPLVVDFWASWCGPCKMMAPAYARAAAQLEPHFRLAKINTEQEQALARQHNIRSIPTMVLFKGGREIARQPGAMDTTSIVRWVEGNA